MSHPFGDLLSRYLHRKHGLSQSKLADGILQDPSVITKMCKGQRLAGTQARERVVAITAWLRAQAAIETVAEANALLGRRRDGAPAFRTTQANRRSCGSSTPAAACHTLPGGASASATTQRTNLPAALTSFIGRTA